MVLGCYMRHDRGWTMPLNSQTFSEFSLIGLEEVAVMLPTTDEL